MKQLPLKFSTELLVIILVGLEAYFTDDSFLFFGKFGAEASKEGAPDFSIASLLTF